MTQRDRVLGLLRGHEARRIRFTVPSASVPVTINHVTFTTVANAIVAGKIGVSPFAVTAGGLAAMILLLPWMDEIEGDCSLVPEQHE